LLPIKNLIELIVNSLVAAPCVVNLTAIQTQSQVIRHGRCPARDRAAGVTPPAKPSRFPFGFPTMLQVVSAAELRPSR
jgi:hypothetical protein